MSYISVDNREFLEANGLAFIDACHSGRRIYIHFTCKCGEPVKRLAEMVRTTFPGCAKCAHLNRDSRLKQKEDVKAHASKSGAIILDFVTEGRNTFAIYQCKCGNPGRRRLNQILKYDIVDCETCRIARLPRGSEAPGWNPDLTDEEREHKRTAHRAWANAVIKRDEKCVITGSTEKLCAHHLYSYTRYPELRKVLENGITLTRPTHLEFHRQYGKAAFTPEDFVSFFFERTGRHFEIPATLRERR